MLPESLQQPEVKAAAEDRRGQTATRGTTRWTSETLPRCSWTETKDGEKKGENYQIFICAPRSRLVFWGHQKECWSRKETPEKSPSGSVWCCYSTSAHRFPPGYHRDAAFTRAALLKSCVNIISLQQAGKTNSTLPSQVD